MSSSLRVLRTLVVLWTMCILIGGQKTTTEDNTCTNVGSVEERLKGLEEVTQEMYQLLLQQQHVPQPINKQLLQQHNVTQQMQKQLLQQQNVTQQICNQTPRMMNSSQTQCEKDVQQQNITQEMYKQLLEQQNITQHMCKQQLQMMNQTQYGQGGRVYLSAIGQAVDLAAGRGDPRVGTGGWLLDPADPDGKAWEFSGDTVQSMTQYASKSDMINKENPVTIQLGYDIKGRDHVILNGYLYGYDNCGYGYVGDDSRYFIVKKDIRSPTAVKTVKTIIFPGVYSWYSDNVVIDFAVDELGLWAIFSTLYSSTQNVSMARIDPDTMAITGTWVIQRRTSGHEYAFMISGILYIIDQNNPATKIEYMFDTNTNAGKAVDIPIPGPTHNYLTQASYIPAYGKILVWDYGHLQEYPVTLVGQKPKWYTVLNTAEMDNGIRLVDGDYDTEGRVEVYDNVTGTWGTVCRDGWDNNDAKVVCRMLGLPYQYATAHRTIFGQGSGEIFLDDVDCDGSELDIRDCDHAGWGVNHCSHWQDAGVSCLS